MPRLDRPQTAVLRAWRGFVIWCVRSASVHPFFRSSPATQPRYIPPDPGPRLCTRETARNPLVQPVQLTRRQIHHHAQHHAAPAASAFAVLEGYEWPEPGGASDRRSIAPGRRDRRRVRRNRHGRGAAAGRNQRLPDHRQGRRPRRDVARQYLSGPVLRRALQPLLVLVPALALEPPVPGAAGDSGLPAGGSRRAQARSAPATGLRGDRSQVRRRQRHLEPHPCRRRNAARGRAGFRRGPAQSPELPRHPRPGRLRRPVMALRPLGSWRRPDRKAGGGHRHRGERDPVRARDRPANCPPRRVPAQRPVRAAEVRSAISPR